MEGEPLFGRFRRWNLRQSVGRFAVTMQSSKHHRPCGLYLRYAVAHLGGMGQNCFCLRRIACAVIDLAQTGERQVVVGRVFQNFLILLLSLAEFSPGCKSLPQQQTRCSVFRVRLKVSRKDLYRFCWIP